MWYFHHQNGCTLARKVAEILLSNPKLQFKVAIQKVTLDHHYTDSSAKERYYCWRNRLEEIHGLVLFIGLRGTAPSISCTGPFNQPKPLYSICEKSSWNMPIRWKSLNVSWSESLWFNRQKTVFGMRKAKYLDKKRTGNSLFMKIEIRIPKITDILQDHPTLIFIVGDSPIKWRDWWQPCQECIGEQKQSLTLNISS